MWVSSGGRGLKSHPMALRYFYLFYFPQVLSDVHGGANLVLLRQVCPECQQSVVLSA